MSDYLGTATYSPEDNKLRLYPFARLSPADYARVKEAGFIWAPRQELFVAPMWTPAREDLLIEMCGEIGDEDTSLVERAEERADRFQDYSAARREDAERAQKAVSAIADNIPLGQPILVGHHSERRARKDAEKIENGMRRTVKMWETAAYWKERAAGALAHAKYKELPTVRHRRIKGIESDKRREERANATSQTFIPLWEKVLSIKDPAAQTELALRISNSGECHVSRCFSLADFPRNPPASQYEGSMSLWSALNGGVITGQQAAEIALRCHRRAIASRDRWINHYNNRLEYERTMLDEQGGHNADKWDIKPGGRVLVGSEWYVVIRVNKSGGQVVSVTTNSPYVRVKGIEKVKDYREPDPEEAAKVEKATKLPPLCNYPGEGFLHMTKAEYEKDVPRWSDFSKIRPVAATDTHGKHRVRVTRNPKGAWYNSVAVYLTDEKRKDPPPAPPEPIHFERQIIADTQPRPTWKPSEEQQRAEEARKAAAAGVQVVSAPQLFPTPPDLARRMVNEAGCMAGRRILEPSAGTGNIIKAAQDNATGADNCRTVAVEINPRLAAALEERRSKTLGAYPTNHQVICTDFLECNGDLGQFDYVLMNPPFENGSDIKHIQHAMKFLKPGGRLVAICANGPRQNAQLRPLIEDAGGIWEDLPADTFKASGTSVNTALLVYDAPEETPAAAAPAQEAFAL